jgi:hypothetical protein
MPLNIPPSPARRETAMPSVLRVLRSNPARRSSPGVIPPTPTPTITLDGILSVWHSRHPDFDGEWIWKMHPDDLLAVKKIVGGDGRPLWTSSGAAPKIVCAYCGRAPSVDDDACSGCGAGEARRPVRRDHGSVEGSPIVTSRLYPKGHPELALAGSAT